MPDYIAEDDFLKANEGQSYVSEDDFMGQTKNRGALGEIGTGLKRGVIGQLPKMVGQAMEWAGEEKGLGFKKGLYEKGKEIADRAQARLDLPQNLLHPEQHNIVTNALAEGGEMIAPSVAVPLAVGAGLSALPGTGIGGAASLGIAALAGSAPMGMSQAQESYERAKEAGASEETARSTGWKSGAIEALGETAGTYLGGKLLGIGGKVIGKTANRTMGGAIENATDTALLKPFGKQLVKTALGEVATEMGQGAGQAYVERQAGVQTDPWQAAKESIAPTLGMTALLAPFGLAGHYRNTKRAEAIDQTLSDPQAATPEERMQVVSMLHRDATKAKIPDADQWYAGAVGDIAAGRPVRRGTEQAASPQPNSPLTNAVSSAAGWAHTSPATEDPGLTAWAAQTEAARAYNQRRNTSAADDKRQQKNTAKNAEMDRLVGEYQNQGAGWMHTERAEDKSQPFTMRPSEEVYSPFSPDIAQQSKTKALPPAPWMHSSTAQVADQEEADWTKQTAESRQYNRERNRPQETRDTAKNAEMDRAVRQYQERSNAGWALTDRPEETVTRRKGESIKKFRERLRAARGAGNGENSLEAGDGAGAIPGSSAGAGGVGGPVQGRDGVVVEREDRQPADSVPAQGAVKTGVGAGQAPTEVAVGGETVLSGPGMSDNVEQAQQKKGAVAENATGAGASPVDTAAAEAALSPENNLPEPTDGQKEAGNYKKAHVRIHGLDISIENPAGSVRSGTDPDGKRWETPMRDHYGYIKGTVGKDKDHLDVFVPEGFVPTERDMVAVVDQIDPKTGKFDEHKIIFGAQGESAAKTTYLRNYDATGATRIGGITMMPVKAFKGWLSSGETKKPLGTAGNYETQEADRPGGETVTAPSKGEAGKQMLWLDEEYISGLSAMARGRLMKALAKRYNTRDGERTLREYIESGGFTGTDVSEVPAVQYDRRKYNRMDSREQAEYNKRLEAKKTEYSVTRDDDTSFQIPKIVFDAIRKDAPEPAQPPAKATPENPAEVADGGQRLPTDKTGARKQTAKGKARVDIARAAMRDLIRNPDIVGKDRADRIANAKVLVGFLQANAAKDLDTGYERGQQVAYTGEDAPEGMRSFIYLEGPKAGEYGVAATPEKRGEDAKREREARQRQQDGFKRVRESRQEQAAKEPWQMTSGEFSAQELEADEYRDQLEGSAQDLRDFRQNTDLAWRRSVESRAEVGRVPDAALDDYIEKYGEDTFWSMFRGVAEKGRAGYVLPKNRGQEGFTPVAKKYVSDLKPHERTWEQQRTAIKQGMPRKISLAEWKEERANHKSAVQKALWNGEKVPASVLADYPELADAKPRKDADMADVPERDFGNMEQPAQPAQAEAASGERGGAFARENVKKGHYIKRKQPGLGDRKVPWELVSVVSAEGVMVDNKTFVVQFDQITDIRTGMPELGRGEVIFKDGMPVGGKVSAQTTSEKDEETTSSEATKSKVSPKSPNAPIADFGEKIGGARKDVWSKSLDDMRQVDDADVAAQPLSKVWPAPDYQKMLDKEGADKSTVALVRALRDSIPTKPRAGWKLQKWAEAVTAARGVAVGLLDGSIDTARARHAIQVVNASKLGEGILDQAELYELVGHEKSLAGIRIASAQYSLLNGVEYNPSKELWSVEQQAKATAFSNWPRQLSIGETRQEAIEKFVAKYNEMEINKPASKQVDFSIYSYRSGKEGFYVGKKVGRNYIDLAGPFNTAKEARKYKSENQEALVDKLAKAKEIPSERRDTNNPRVGEDMRGGQDVTPEMFRDAFGFRGVEFGNWVEQKKRQSDLNDAYDALMDMAAILEVNPKAISLNGELALAFGARGSGGRSAGGNTPAAHYEPGKVVINLTKKRGAGSLGHEWWHALDNYFAKMRKGDGYLTEALDVSLVERGSVYEHKGEVRKEMVDAFGGVMKAIRSTAMKARASKLDNRRSAAYWTTKPEMSARAFESYLISKLHDQGASNDYLANIVDDQTWKAAESLGFELDDSYPYPTAGEMPKIRGAFDHFFQTVEQKETDKGVALFSTTTQPIPESDRADIPGEIAAAFGRLRARVLMRKITVLGSQEEAKALVARLRGLGVSAPDDRDIKPPSSQRALNRAILDLKFLGSVTESAAFSDNGYDGLDVKTKGLVAEAVKRTVNYFKIFDPVIGLVPVEVVNIFTGREFSPEKILNDISVLKNLNSTDAQDSVSTRGDAAVSKKPPLLGGDATATTVGIVSRHHGGKTLSAGRAGLGDAASGYPAWPGAELGVSAPFDLGVRNLERLATGKALESGRVAGALAGSGTSYGSAPSYPAKFDLHNLPAGTTEDFWHGITPNDVVLDGEVEGDTSASPFIFNILYSGQKNNGIIQGLTATVEGAPRVFLVADGIKKGQTVPVLLHEMGEHAARLGFAQDAEYQAILKSLERRATMQNTTGEAIRAALARVPEGTKPEHKWSEVAAYLIENNANSKIGIVRRILAFFKKWLYKAGRINADKLTVEDLVLFARSATLAHTGATYGEGVRQSVRDLFKPVDTESGAFKRWFGDSKVVDADGKPLVVYHGTNSQDDFMQFNTSSSELGSHFGTKRQSENRTETFFTVNGSTPIPKIIKAYLSIKNPLRVVDLKGFSVENVAYKLEEMGVFSPEQADRAVSLAKESDYTIRSEGVAFIQGELIKKGYDGIVYLNRSEGIDSSGRRLELVSDNSNPALSDAEFIRKWPDAEDSYIAFRPEQIKSALSNTGAFSPTDPRIRYSRAMPQTATATFKRWFGNSKITKNGEPNILYHGTQHPHFLKAKEYPWIFDQDRPRNPGNSDLSGLGIFLGGMDAAEMHAGFEGTVHPFYVRMENPYVTTAAELEKKVAASGAEAFKKRLQDLNGHDGIIIKDRGHAIVFDANQVKSAEQNTGAFSTENNDVRFSMGGKVADDPKLAAERQRVLGERANRIIETVAKDGLTGAAEQNLFAFMAGGLDIVDTADADLRTKAWDWFKALPKAVARKSLGALTLRQLRDVFAKDIPQMGTFYQASRDIAADANRLMTTADEVYNKWAALDKRNAKSMSELMIRATIAGVNPDVANFEPRANIKRLREGMNKNLARIAEIRAKGKAATAEEAAEMLNLESKTRDKADRIQNEVKRRSEFEKISVMYRNLSPAAKEVYQAVKKQYTDNLNDLFEALEARITRQIKDPKQRKHALDAIRLRYDKYIQEGPYFPLSRFGDYIAIAEKDGGASREVRTFDSVAERTRYSRARRAEGWTVQEKTKKEYSRETQGASGSFFEGVIKIIQANEGIKAAERKVLIDEVNQHFIKSMPDLSHRKHFVHRRKVEGYSRDQMRAFADNMQHAAHHIARIRHADKMTAAAESVLAESRMLGKDQNGDAYVDLHNELTKRLEIMNNPDISPVTQAITSFGFVMNIGPSIASALVNMSQTPLVAFPVLATKFKGIGSTGAMNALMKASADYFTSKPKLATGPSLVGNAKLPQEERDMIRALIDDGTIDVTQAHSLAQAAGNDYFNLARTKYGHVGARAMRLVSYPFHVAELANRKITALAAYRMARQSGMGHLAAVSQAREVVLDAHFDYSQQNRARWMEGNTRRVLLLFKQYSQQMTWLLGRSFYQAAKGESKEVRQAAAKQLGMILAGHFIVAGAMGMPVLGGMIGTLSFLANLAGDDDEPKDLEVSIRNFLADTFGQAGGDAVMNGPWRMLPGLGQLDLSNRMSLGDLWFRAPNKEMEGRDQFNQYVNLLLGPVATNAANVFMGVNSMANGEVWRGIEMMLPKAVKDGMKAMRYSTEGVKNWKHDTLLEDLGAVELFGQALGFTPSRVSEMYAGANAVKNHETRIERRRQVLMNRWVNAIRGRDQEKAREAMEAITAFNAKNPIFRIDYRRNLIPSLRNRMKVQAQTKEGVYVPATRNEIRQVGRFANI